MKNLDHIILQDVSSNSPRRKHGGGNPYEGRNRDHQKFHKQKLQELDLLKASHNEKKVKFGSFLNPNLIFKLRINQGVNESTFKKELERAGIQILNSSTINPGYWIAFSDDSEFKKFKLKMTRHLEEKKYKCFFAIDELIAIPPEEKIGVSLRNFPIDNMGFENVDIEIWRMEDERLDEFLEGFENFLKDNNCSILDRLRTINFCLLRAKINARILAEITSLGEVASIDRPPILEIETMLNDPIEEYKIRGPPRIDSASIAVLDSGILRHPILDDAIGDFIKLDQGEEIEDHSGHGTTVASICLFGDIEKCIRKSTFNQNIWLYSLKIMFRKDQKVRTDTDRLLENRIKELVEKTTELYPNCKIFNVSFGIRKDILTSDIARNFNLAVLLDELAKRLNILFVISIGNTDPHLTKQNYPVYLLENKENKLINPASSALSLTVGGVVRRIANIEQIDVPSTITRVGPGFRGMIKPELVEYSGGGFGHDSDIIVVNPRSVGVTESRSYSLSQGTSLSAPKISHYLALLRNQFPHYSLNMLKCLLLSSAVIPKERPGFLGTIQEEGLESDIPIECPMRISMFILFIPPTYEWNLLYSRINRI